MGLDLSKAPILDDEEREGFQSSEEILNEVMAEAEKKGLPSYPRPTTNPESLADKDIENMPNNVLGQLLVRYTAYAQYIYGELAKVEVGYKIGVANLKLLDSRLKTKLFAQDVPKDEIPSRIREDPLRIEAEIEMLKLFAMKEILEAHYRAYDKQQAALSRIITLRELEFNQSLKEMGMAGRRKGPVRPSRSTPL